MDLAIGLIGYIVLFLGLMKIVEELVGLRGWRIIRPLMVRLFPDVPADHPAMGAIIMNVAANALGLGNAATPFGLKAMKELNEINPHKGTASSHVSVFGHQHQRARLAPNWDHWSKNGSVDPAAIFPPHLWLQVYRPSLACWRNFWLVSLSLPPADDDFVAPEPQQSQSSLSELIPLAFFAASLIGLVLVVYVWGSRQCLDHARSDFRYGRRWGKTRGPGVQDLC